MIRHFMGHPVAARLLKDEDGRRVVDFVVTRPITYVNAGVRSHATAEITYDATLSADGRDVNLTEGRDGQTGYHAHGNCTVQ